MSAYLQRLLARTAPGTGIALSPPSIPVAPLSSPLAAHDQRLGLPDLEPAVPSEFDQPQPDEKRLETGGERRRPDDRKPPRKESADTRRRIPPELRLVGEAPYPPPKAGAPAKSGPDSPAPMPASVDAPAFAPGPLDIAPVDLEPIVESVEEETVLPIADKEDGSIEAPAPAPRAKMPLNLPGETDDSETRLDRGEPVEDARRSIEFRPVTDIEPAARKRIPLPEPYEIDDAADERPAPAVEESLPEPAERMRNHAAHDIEPRALELPAAPSVSIDQIVIDVHEPQQVPTAQAATRSGPLPTAAAASIIGPLPVRRSTVGLFGMRRR